MNEADFAFLVQDKMLNDMKRYHKQGKFQSEYLPFLKWKFDDKCLSDIPVDVLRATREKASEDMDLLDEKHPMGYKGLADTIPMDCENIYWQYRHYDDDAQLYAYLLAIQEEADKAILRRN